VRKIDGLTVRNAVSPLRIMVTKQDIEKGAPKNPDACAIAIAVMRQVPGVSAAKVHKSCLFANVKGKWRRWAVAEYATREIIAFDRGGRFVPGEYDFMPIPVPLTKVRRHRSSTVRLESYKRRPSHITQDVREEARKNEPAPE
jgi:hypothetical protein